MDVHDILKINKKLPDNMPNFVLRNMLTHIDNPLRIIHPLYKLSTLHAYNICHLVTSHLFTSFEWHVMCRDFLKIQ